MNSENSIHDKKTDLRAPQRNPQQGDRKYQTRRSGTSGSLYLAIDFKKNIKTRQDKFWLLSKQQ